MNKVNKHHIYYQSFDELSDEVKYGLKRKGYDENISLPILSIEYWVKDVKENIRQLEELSQPLVFVSELEIKKGEEELEKFEQDDKITEIDVYYYIPKK